LAFAVRLTVYWSRCGVLPPEGDGARTAHQRVGAEGGDDHGEHARHGGDRE